MAAPRTPKTVNEDLRSALAKAIALREPLFVPSPTFVDDRGWSLMNQMQGVMSPEGQINYSVQHPGVIKAWHRHKLQTDFWMCLRGHIKVGVHRDDDEQSWLLVTGEQKPGVVIIPPTLWHGAATVGAEPAGLFYYVTHAFNPKEPDEERRAFDSVPGFPWETRHR
ncbi:MAG: dTDP-4-dehydrorhamnose 3,5-epimerase family protein [Phycisphaerae bacterium]|nr:dTDP-4-dehydrorhamnose 3,5-epimerase family protein [Phycisphaerae bacterium]